MDKPKSVRFYLEVTALGVLFLFFLQLLTHFIESIYAFGLLQTSLTLEVASIVLLFSPLLLFAFRRGLPAWALVLLADGVVVCRLAEGVLDTRGKLLVAGLGVGLFFVFLPGLLFHAARQDPAGRQRLGIAFAFSGLALILLKTLHSGNDLSDYGWFQLINWALALLPVLGLPFWLRNEPLASTDEARGGSGQVISACIGLFGALVLVYFALSSPAVVARWTGGSYPWLVGGMALAQAVMLAALLLAPGRVLGLSKRWLLLWNMLFVLVLTAAIALQQTAFPSDPGAYPLMVGTVSPLAWVTLALAVVLSPVALLDLTLFAAEIVALRPRMPVLAGGFLLGVLFLLLMVFFSAFTTVYDYIPVIGPLWRDNFWLVFLLAGLSVTLPLLALPAKPRLSAETSDLVCAPVSAGAALALAVIALAAALILPARPAAAAPKDSLRVMTYNIQQGYSRDGLKNYTGQLEAIRAASADIVGLAESDVSRVVNGNGDEVRLIADQLGLYSYFGPKTVTGTFGIALLSKYPIQNAQTFYMFSEGEQTAAILAEIEQGGRVFTILVTHLGNKGPLIQQQQVLAALAGRENIIAMGDFNFRPDTEQYRLTTATLDDAWVSAVSPSPLKPEQAEKRIDHIFISPGLTSQQAAYLYLPDSDHPAMVAEVR